MRRSRRLALVAAAAAAATAALVLGVGRGPARSDAPVGGATAASTGQPVAAPAVVDARRRRGGGRLAVERLARLPAAVADPAVAMLGGAVYAAGGLDTGDTSTGTVLRIRGRSVRREGALPVPLHDAAAAAPGRRLLVFGGGQAASFAGIGSFDPASRRTRLVAALPTPLSDLAAALVRRTVYLVGGFTGSAFSDRILAYSGGRVRVAARLPVGLRYAAVAAVRGSVLIAGGRTLRGPSAAVYRFTPGSRTVVRVATLPVALMHAAGAALGGRLLVAGGIDRAGRRLASVYAVSPDGSVRSAARLPLPLSDAGAASTGRSVLLVGGRGDAGALRSVLRIAAAAAGPKRRAPGARSAGRPRHAPTLPALFRGPLPGDLLIADRGNDRMLLVDPAHRVLWRYPSRPGQPPLNFDDDTFFAPGGHSIISNQEESHDIVRISYPSGHVVWRYGHPGVAGSAPGYLNTPDDAYQLPDGLVVVADAYNCRVLEIRGKQIVRSIGRAGVCAHDPPHTLGAVNGDTPLANGHLLVSEIDGSYIDDFTLSGRLLHVYRAPVTYPSDPQPTRKGNIILADYTRPGGVVILSAHTGRTLWTYRPTSGPGMLDHPSLAAMLPDGDVVVGDDYNDRIVVIDPHTRRIVWQYGHTAVGGRRHGYLHIPDGFDFVPVTPGGRPDPAAIRHGPPAR